eukprot:m.428653 g.428653  ORF g.428653 m.428653 type:complete len:59 (-) comp70078_c0_seq1:56-232(-)
MVLSSRGIAMYLLAALQLRLLPITTIATHPLATPVSPSNPLNHQLLCMYPACHATLVA